MLRVIIRWRKLRIMTRQFQIIAQIIGVIAQCMMGPSAALFGWSPELVTWLHAGVGCVQAVLGILAHDFNRDGSRTNQ